jgi:hypothetical protein
MKTKPIACLAVLAGLLCQARCSTNITLAVGSPASGVTNASFTVSTGQVARIGYAYVGNGGGLYINLSNASFLYQGYTSPASQYFPVLALPLPVVVGPATILLNSWYGGPVLCTIEVSNPSDSFVPSNAVVIPADSGGPVNIILESSVDLVNWTAALPGTYGTSTTKRFFRVRAERSP